MLTQTQWTGAIQGTVGYAYDNDFRVSEIKVNAASPISYGYDPDGLLTTAGALTLSRDAHNGLLTGTTLGQSSDSRTHTGFGETQTYAAKHGTTSLLATSYTYDTAGRITRKTETVQGAAVVYEYAYDPASRLAEVRRDGVVTATYGYDANGNRTHVNGVEVARYDDQDRLTAYHGAAYAYTANGELASKTVGESSPLPGGRGAGGEGVTRYRYDLQGNLRQVDLPDGTRIDYAVDGENRRIAKKVNGVPVQGFLWQDSLKPAAELDGNSQIVARYVYATRANVPDYLIKGGQTYRIITDHLGSPRLIVNTANGEVAQRIDYDDWGRVTLDTNPGFQPFGFAGGLYDRDTGLVRFGARDYDPETGRWTAKDPVLFAGGDANLYGYVADDPVNRIDPLGLVVEYEKYFSDFFRSPNPNHPPDAGLVDYMNGLPIDPGTDCSEIAEKLFEFAGKGKILNVLPAIPGQLKLIEYKALIDKLLYHQVYTDGKYVYDPRFNSEAIPLGDWNKMIYGLNPGAVIVPILQSK